MTQTETSPETSETTEKATFGAGCFWQVEDEFRKIDGVIDTAVGYEGGHVDNPTYEQVCSGTTGHVEVAQIEFDPAKVSFEELVAKYFTIHDPTQLNRQGPDVGYQYRSVIFAHSDEQAETARRVIEQTPGTVPRPDRDHRRASRPVLARRGVPPVLRAEARRAPGTPVVAARALTALTALALLVAGCGDEEDDNSAVSADSHGDPPRARSRRPRAAPSRRRRSSDASRTDGSECGRLKATDFAPIDPQTPCTEIYGGPDEVVAGRNDRRRAGQHDPHPANGCEIDRFDRITPLLEELFPDYEPGASLAP